MSLLIVLDGLTSDPSRARHEVERALEADGYTGDVRGVMLLVSELVTNAVRHGTPPITLVLATTGDSVEVSVDDRSIDDTPTVRYHDGDQPSDGGYGLLIVDELAEEWGWTPLPEGGKRVWFSMR